MNGRRRPFDGLVAGAMAVGLAACGGSPPTGELVEFSVPVGASFDQVIDTLTARELVAFPAGFKVMARLRGDDRGIRAGGYAVSADIGWFGLLDTLVQGRVATRPVTIPEGFTLHQIASRIAEIAQTDEAAVLSRLTATDAATAWSVPGPTLEGYLFPDTYRFAPGIPLDSVISTMVGRYRSFWTPERREQAEAMGLTEREVATLASIIQGEARRVDEMPTISAVFHNRMEIGYLLQADPTVQYALGQRRARLLYADIDSVADHPYNTYTQPGLPPGPIGAPGHDALAAALSPADVGFLYFVARPDGSHIFTRSLQEHNRARVEARREWDAVQADTPQEGDG
jgi:UPF0755 protein